ncbi:unnamed protein product [Cuscuta campestris]|uniref:Uncharacterized protein n=1 Tax=Cuscuta campestris TaxID=132261 RepID=A0A484KYA6_9ASTE|nr:unnamed protein product [Cuscuta campestris]
MSPVSVPRSTLSTFVPRMVNSVHLINLATSMDGVGPSNIPGTSKGRDVVDPDVAKPSKTRDSAFKRLEIRRMDPASQPKRVGPEMARACTFDQLGGGRDGQPAPLRHSRDAETIHLDEEKAKGQPRQLAYT